VANSIDYLDRTRNSLQNKMLRNSFFQLWPQKSVKLNETMIINLQKREN